jgi:hypothetical protein
MVIEILRWVIILQAAWVLGVAIVIIPAYARDLYFAHITLVATSYSGLVILAAFRSFYEVAIPDVIYVPAVSVLFLLGDISLLILIQRRKTRKA